ncbi:hypothetical protein SEUCBS139899_000092 [Sporothrix eucalyptigena]|uniref:Phospholipase/carboxylesterase/thioesterase domain-containing protein n=1 Tax=Sporothrix eucalyptigena TaxID=1812306 RepID=A0ABP0ARK4_9PEZI
MSSFGPVHIVEPRPGHPHSHTAVLLHGRGSTGEEFAEELFETALSDLHTPNLAGRLPSWRWVFPSSPSTWNATFQEWMPAWFEAHSLADPTERQDLQQAGLQASAMYVRSILEQESQRLQSATGLVDDSRLVLGGISLGGAVALWTLLGTVAPERPLGGFVAVSTWLPFADEVRRYLVGSKDVTQESKDETEIEGTPVTPLAFVQKHMASFHQHLQRRKAGDVSQTSSVLSMPVFVGHGRDDAYVDVELGRQAQKLLTDVGFTAEWKDYEGAEQEGHWLKEPEEMDDLARFLTAVRDRTSSSP